MFPRREKISIPAHDAIVDGDDVYITESFDEDEENASVVANASCHTRSFAVGIPDNTKSETKNSLDKRVQYGEKNGIQLSKRSLKVKKILRKIGQSHRQLPLKFPQISSLFHSSSNTVGEYEEMIENGFGLEEEGRYDLDDETIASLRSSRNNVRTGMSMLVRQKAQVMGRPSTAHSNWEISQSPDPKNFRNLMLRGKSLVLDDCSIGGMSDITEDASTFYGFPSMDLQHLSFRRTPMFINADTYRINEDEGESESDDEDNDSRGSSCDETIERGYDFRELSPLNESVESTMEDSSGPQSPVVDDTNAMRFSIEDPMRRRIHSDSDVDSEAYRNLSSLTSTSTWMYKAELQNSIRRRSLDAFHRDGKFIRKSFGKRTEESDEPAQSSHVAAYASWPFPRTRTYSDSYVDQTQTDDDLRDTAHKEENVIVEIQSLLSRLDTEAKSLFHHSKEQISDKPLISQSSRRQSLPIFESVEQGGDEISRSRTYSDSAVHEKSAQEDILWEPRNISLLDDESIPLSSTRCTGVGFQTFGFDESPAPETLELESHALRNEKPASPTKTIDNGNAQPEPATSSVLATLSHMNSPVADMLVANESRKKPLHQSSVRNPSPRTLNAASMIAAALRPAPAKRLPALPTPSPSAAARQSSDEYYWGSTDVECSTNRDKNDPEEDRAMELKNLCSWGSSESFDDIF